VALITLLALAPAMDAQAAGCSKLTRPYMSTTATAGATFLPFRLPAHQSRPITWGIAALDDSGTLVMQADDSLWASEDDGCKWTQIGHEVVGFYRVAAASQGYAYAWQQNGGAIYRVRRNDGPGPRWEVTYIKGKVNDMNGFAVDPADPLHVRTAGDPGQIWESFNGGQSWSPVGVPAMPGGFLGYVTAFDPADLDHVVYGRVTDGGFVTFDGGQTWTQATGLASAPGSNVNLFNAVISPADGDTVFAAAIDFSTGSSKRHIYASTDGGLTYGPVLTNGVGGVHLQNSPVMKADADDPDVLRFIFSVSPVFGGTFFYQYDLGSGLLYVVQNAAIPKVREFEPSRAAPGSIHVGFDFN